MAGRTSAYSYINVTATIDRRIIQGLWEGDDAVEVAYGEDRGTGVTGADGSSLFSISANKSATVTLRVQHTSPTHRLLQQKLKQQQARGAAFGGFSFSVKDRVSGEGGSCDKVYIQTAPGKSYGVNAQAREWVLWCGEYVEEIPNNG